MDLEALINQLAETLIVQRARIRVIVEGVPDEAIMQLVAECKRQAQPGDTHNFAMPEWDYVADNGGSGIWAADR